MQFNVREAPRSCGCGSPVHIPFATPYIAVEPRQHWQILTAHLSMVSAAHCPRRCRRAPS